ncbi:MAG: hypothetical protein K6E45_03965 [Bacteroidaceae bacterium]|jgi:hypothetical protein|nr:hypothetical protein [Bacteroidaceae bacterium]
MKKIFLAPTAQIVATEAEVIIATSTISQGGTITKEEGGGKVVGDARQNDATSIKIHDISAYELK